MLHITLLIHTYGTDVAPIWKPVMYTELAGCNGKPAIYGVATLSETSEPTLGFKVHITWM